MRVRVAPGSCLILLSGIAMAGAASPASAAQGPWLPPSKLSLLGLYAGAPQVAVAPDGTTTAVWARFLVPEGRFYYQDLTASTVAVVQASTRRPGERFSTAVNVSDGTQDAGSAPQIAVGADGTTSVTWTQYDGRAFGVWGSTRPPRGTFGPPVALSPSDRTAFADQVAVAPDGTTTVVWLAQSARTIGLGDGSSTVQARTKPPGGTFGPPVDLTTGEDLEGLKVAVAASGATTVIWSRGSGTGSILQAATRDPDGTFGPSVDLSEPGETAQDPALAVGPDGTATVVWSGRDATPSGRFTVRARTREPGATFGPPVNLSFPTPTERHGRPDIAVAPDGATTVVWSRSDFAVQATTRRAGGRFGVPVDVSGPNAGDPPLLGDGSTGPELAVGADGTATAVWGAPLPGYRLIVRASTRPPGKSFGAPVDLSPLRRKPASYPEVAVGPDGGATAAWLRPDALDHNQVEVAVTAHPPTVRTRAAIIGIARPGRTLHCRLASFRGATSRSTSWLRSGKPIRGAHKTTYTIRQQDLGRIIACRTAATGPEGTATSTSRGTLARR